MTENIRKRGKNYYIILRVPDPIRGGTKPRWEVAGPTLRGAQQRLRARQTELDVGAYVPASKVTFREFVEEEWFPMIEATRRPSTVDGYKRHLRLHVLPDLGDMRLQAISPALLSQLYTKLLNEGRKPWGAKARYSPPARERARLLQDTGFTASAIASSLAEEFPECSAMSRHAVAALLRRDSEQGVVKPAGLDPRTVSNIHVIIHAAFKAAVDLERIARNPAIQGIAPGGKRGVGTGRIMRPWTAPQLNEFLTRLESNRYFAAWVTSATTGLRRSELLGLTVRAVNLDEGFLHITDTLLAVNHKLVPGTPKTDAGVRMVSLDITTLAILRRWHRQRAAERMSLGLGGFTDDDYFFAHADGKPFHPDYFSREFSRAVARVGLPRMPLHGLRHTYATLGLHDGTQHPRIMTDRLGHSSVVITQKLYTQVTRPMDAELAEHQARLIFGDLRDRLSEGA